MRNSGLRYKDTYRGVARLLPAYDAFLQMLLLFGGFSARDHLRCGAWIIVVMAVAAVAKWGGAGSETTNLGAGDARGSY